MKPFILTLSAVHTDAPMEQLFSNPVSFDTAYTIHHAFLNRDSIPYKHSAINVGAHVNDTEGKYIRLWRPMVGRNAGSAFFTITRLRVSIAKKPPQYHSTLQKELWPFAQTLLRDFHDTVRFKLNKSIYLPM